VGNILARFFGGFFVLGAAIGAGTIGVAVLSSNSAAAATVITVNDPGDPASASATGCASPETDCTLRAALAEATILSNAAVAAQTSPAVTIALPSDTYSVESSNGELQDFDTAGVVTVEGLGGQSHVDIEAACTGVGCTITTRVLEIEQGAVADISGVTISDGNPDPAEQGDCGAICVSGGNLTLTDSTVSGNTSLSFGGGIELYHGGSATLSRDTITANTVSTSANENGGGGGIAVNNDDTSPSNLTIQNTTISGNQVDAGSGSGSGGGIDAFNTSGGLDTNLTIDIDDSTISGNGISATSGAGSGIAALDGNWLVTNSTISGNEATGTQVDGGGVFVSNAGSGTSLNSTWNDDTVSGNQAYEGGGIESSGGSSTDATFDTITDNTASNTNSGDNLNVQSGSSLSLGESIVAGGSSSNCSNGGSLHSAGYNLIDDISCGTAAASDIVGENPQLGGLANNGGSTRTQLPASSSPAVSAVPSSVTTGTGVSLDQRGDARGQGQNGSSTIGSVEIAQATPPPPTTTTTTTTRPTTTTTRPTTTTTRPITTTTTTTPTTSPTTTSSASSYGYWLVGSDGGIFSFGSAHFHGSTGSLTLQRPVVGISPTANKGGYWLVASDGGIFAFGNAGYYGSIPGAGLAPAGSGLPHSLNAPIVGIVPSSDGDGYFMVASDGGVFGFGDARFAGSCPGIGGCAGAAAAVVPDASGNGYWLITQSGNVYAFGDAPYYGAPGNQGAPVTSAVRTVDGGGYWVLLADGAVYAYGDAVARGGPVGTLGALNEASAIVSDADGGGYWVAAADGAVSCYGDAPDEGSMAGSPHNGSIIAAAGF
jgi:hypothetical protein